mgnify:CR=1 FL=1
MTSTNGSVTRTAHAKINLTLHVTGQRTDGYHLLDSLVMFTRLGDEITVREADDLTLTIDGPFAQGLSCVDNLVLRAARMMSPDRGAAIHLTKALPVASGIGGGSADAAATLLALSELWDMPLPDWDNVLTLGADVPLCLSTELSRMRGIGEDIQLIGPAPMLDVLLVNPGVGVSTPAVFGALESKGSPPMGDPMPDPFETETWINWIAQQRNDLQGPAIAGTPVIAKVLAVLQAQVGCQIARMSGSGATCYAIFEDFESCQAAKTALDTEHPDWWVAQTDEAP